MDLKNLLSTIKTTFEIKKDVEFNDIHIVLRPLNTNEEMKVIESCASASEATYIYELKKSSLAGAIRIIGTKNVETGKFDDIEFNNDIVEYSNDKDETVKESKYLFMLHQVEVWPTAFLDTVFDAFNDMMTEFEKIIEKNVKFERFNVVTVPEVSERTEANVPKGFKRVVEPEDSSTDTEKNKAEIKNG